MDFYSALFLGAVFSLSSTAVVLKTLSETGELGTLHGKMTAGWLFMQVWECRFLFNLNLRQPSPLSRSCCAFLMSRPKK